MGPNRPEYLIVHCSASPGGCAKLIDLDHRLNRGFGAIGYHYVVGNGRPEWGGAVYHAGLDGLVERGRDEASVGAHAQGFNFNSIGVCLIGGARADETPTTEYFTAAQRRAALELVRGLMAKYSVPVERVLGHCETELGRHKACPVLSMAGFRAELGASAGEGIA